MQQLCEAHVQISVNICKSEGDRDVARPDALREPDPSNHNF